MSTEDSNNAKINDYLYIKLYDDKNDLLGEGNKISLNSSDLTSQSSTYYKVIIMLRV